MNYAEICDYLIRAGSAGLYNRYSLPTHQIDEALRARGYRLVEIGYGAIKAEPITSSNPFEEAIRLLHVSQAGKTEISAFLHEAAKDYVVMPVSNTSLLERAVELVRKGAGVDEVLAFLKSGSEPVKNPGSTIADLCNEMIDAGVGGADLWIDSTTRKELELELIANGYHLVALGQARFRAEKISEGATPAADELDIEDMPELIDALRARLLCDHDSSLDPEAEQYYLLALNALEQAERFMKLALYKTRQARAR